MAAAVDVNRSHDVDFIGMHVATADGAVHLPSTASYKVDMSMKSKRRPSKCTMAARGSCDCLVLTSPRIFIPRGQREAFINAVNAVRHTALIGDKSLFRGCAADFQLAAGELVTVLLLANVALVYVEQYGTRTRPISMVAYVQVTVMN
jgi:hypothetical protein